MRHSGRAHEESLSVWSSAPPKKPRNFAGIEKHPSCRECMHLENAHEWRGPRASAWKVYEVPDGEGRGKGTRTRATFLSTPRGCKCLVESLCAIGANRTATANQIRYGVSGSEPWTPWTPVNRNEHGWMDTDGKRMETSLTYPQNPRRQPSVSVCGTHPTVHDAKERAYIRTFIYENGLWRLAHNKKSCHIFWYNRGVHTRVGT